MLPAGAMAFSADWGLLGTKFRSNPGTDMLIKCLIRWELSAMPQRSKL
jgi:hypothetical protein